MTDWKEADIIINGIRLTPAEFMSVRVAVTSFRFDLAEPGHLETLGPIGPLYDKALKEVEKIINKEKDRKG